MDDLHELVIAPFQEIVDKGKTAVDNAGDEGPMLKSAQSLVKEGERALNRLEPLCRKSLVDYGDSFVHAVRLNNDISDFRSQLEDLLWEFDDYVDADGFDNAKFAELQALSRKAAPKILDMLKRMDLPRTNPPNDNAIVSPPTSPLSTYGVPSVSSGQTIRAGVSPNLNESNRTIRISVGSGHGGGDVRFAEDSMYKQDKMLPNHSNAPSIRSDSTSERPVPEPEEEPPCPPSANPWDIKSVPEPNDEEHNNVAEFKRRPTVATTTSESPIDPMSPLDLKPEVKPLSLSSNGDTSQSEIPGPSYSIFPLHTSRPRTATVSSTLGRPIPEDLPLEQTTTHDSASTPQTGNTPSIRQSGKFSHPSQMDLSHRNSHDWYGHDDSHLRDPSAEHPARNAGGSNSDKTEVSRKPVPNLNADIAPVGLEPVHPQQEVDNGLIPVESEQPSRGLDVFLPSRDCAITATSSFYLLKGFCDGAHQVLSGGIGVKKTRRPGFTTAATVARCSSPGCMYELNFQEIENDVNRLDQATYWRHGIAYRLRFLQKCHLPTKRSDANMYGCIFCVHQGRTLDESDATVFFSSTALLNHIARHPRRLPEIAGLTIIEEAEVPAQYANDFDLHFTRPPKPHPAKQHANEIAFQPSGTAKEQVRKIYGQRLLADESAAHELAQGARLTGITWPLKYDGEWIFAWHNGAFASIPSDIIRLDAPRTLEVKFGGTSHVRAKARWKFAPKDKEKGDWLKFDKDEQISNICWEYPEQWFWTGTNAKGKWGVFPQAFIDSNTLQDLPHLIDRANTLYQERNKSSSVFGHRLGSSLKKAGRKSSRSDSDSTRTSSLDIS